LRKVACAPALAVTMAHSPLANLPSPWLVRPAYVNMPFFASSPSMVTWRTCSGELMVNCVSKPPMPFCFVPIGTLCQALKFSTCVHDGQLVV